jgi:membrane protease YdiL (CAAX protease family)
MIRFPKGLVRNPKLAWAINLVAVSFVFRLSHIDLGMTGQVENVVNGPLLGLIYLATGGNLWAPIIAHGVTDTIDMLLLYLGKYPGS